MAQVGWRGAFLDPRAPDAFERGAGLPTLVEQRAAAPLLSGGIAAALLVLRAAVALLALDLLCTLVYYSREAAPPGKWFSPVYGFVALYQSLDEVARLEAAAPAWVATLVFGFACVVGTWFAFSVMKALGAVGDAFGATGSMLGRFGSLARTSIVDRAIAVLSRPLGHGREGAWRIVVLVTGFVGGTAILMAVPPRKLLDVVYVEPSFGLFASFLLYAKLASAYLTVAFLTIQSAWQIPPLLALVRWKKHRRVTDWRARPSNNAANMTVLHWSDLHITPFADSLRTDKINVGGNLALEQMVRGAQHLGDEVDAIILTGDSTDAGRSAEWAQFFEIAASVLDRIVLVPGNHDLNIVDPLRWSIVGDDRGIGRALRQIRMMAALDAVQGERAYIVIGDELTPLHAYLAGISEPLCAFYDKPKADEIEFVNACFNQCFPMAVKVGDEFVVDVFDSNDVASNVITNAFGRVADRALARFEILVKHFADRGHVVALHHHLGYPSHIHEKLAKDAAMGRFLVLQNAREVAGALEHLGNTVVLHGHRHIGYEGVVGTSIQVMSARSSTLGDSCEPSTEVGYQKLQIERDGKLGAHVLRVDKWRPPQPCAET